MGLISYDDTMDLDEWLPDTPVQLPLLLSLHLGHTDSHPGFTTTIFNCTNAPLLTSLTYDGSGHDEVEEMPVDAIIAFIRRSSCSLECLVLDWPAVQHMMDIIRMLRHAPTLKTLDLILKPGQSVDPLFLHLANRGPPGGHETYLQNLTKLKLNVHHPFDWNLFVNIWLTRESILSGYTDAGSSRIDLLSQRDFLR